MSEFKQIGAIVSGERRRLWKRSPGLGLQSLWQQVVGADIAANTSIISMRRGIMTVGCSSGGWVCELKLSAKAIARRLNRLEPPEKITEIRFVHQAATSWKSRK